MEKVSEKYFEEGFGTENIQENDLITQETTQENQDNIQETPKKRQRNNREKIISLLEKEPQLSVKSIAKKLGHTENNVRHHLRRMTEEGIIKHEGATKSGKWVIIQND